MPLDGSAVYGLKGRAGSAPLRFVSPLQQSLSAGLPRKRDAQLESSPPREHRRRSQSPARQFPTPISLPRYPRVPPGAGRRSAGGGDDRCCHAERYAAHQRRLWVVSCASFVDCASMGRCAPIEKVGLTPPGGHSACGVATPQTVPSCVDRMATQRAEWRHPDARRSRLMRRRSFRQSA